MPSSGNDVLIQFTNCRLVRDHQLIRDDLWIRNGRIINPEPVFFDEKKQAHKKYDCNNAIIAAGYIDLQINGTLMKFVLCGAVYACACVFVTLIMLVVLRFVFSAQLPHPPLMVATTNIMLFGKLYINKVP